MSKQSIQKDTDEITDEIRISIQNLSYRSPTQVGTYAVPVEIASFSYNSDRQVCLDQSELKYYYAPKIGSDLNLGFPQKYTMRSNQKPEYLDSLLQCLQHKNYTSPDPIRPDFCTCVFYFNRNLIDLTGRGIITKFMTTPFSPDPWTLILTRYNVCNKSITHYQEHNLHHRRISTRLRKQ